MIVDAVYAHGAHNRIGKMVDRGATTYTVNLLNQLTALGGAETASYTYGNRVR